MPSRCVCFRFQRSRGMNDTFEVEPPQKRLVRARYCSSSSSCATCAIAQLFGGDMLSGPRYVTPNACW